MDILERMPWLAQDAVFKRLASIAEVAAMSIVAGLVLRYL